MTKSIQQIASDLMAPGHGILAADESVSSMNKRLASVGVDETSEMARQFRQLMFTADGVGDYLSGAILFDETLRQNDDSGKPLPHVLETKGVIPGVKVDLGLIDLPGFPDEQVSRGLDTLPERLKEYYELGARFTKWRSVIRIDAERGLPTEQALTANAHVLTRYALAVQEAGMVPMVEPEVLFDGVHTLAESANILRATLEYLFDELMFYNVALEGLLLKTSMALPGKQTGTALVPIDIARETVQALRDTVPAQVGGIVFLSGGQTPKQATQNLHAICKLGERPWPMTFSFSRAIEEPVLTVWRGDSSKVGPAQEAFIHRLMLCAAARSGTYTPDME
jgi:fructose-bisphosphate aldolase class I